MGREATVSYLREEFRMDSQAARYAVTQAHSTGESRNTRVNALVTFTADGGFTVADLPGAR
jgi:hypothetical protein